MTIKPKKIKKIALITGVTGQDGSYLAELLLKKNYQVHGLIRRSSSPNTSRISKLIQDKNIFNKKFFTHYFDISDSTSITYLINEINPNEVYNLAAQSDVGLSFKMPNYTLSVNFEGTLYILDAIRQKKNSKIKFYQASTSELYGKVFETPQNESTPFYPRSPYAISKLCSYWITKNYREAYNLYACNGILYNHESPRRGENFVTRKITIGLSKIYLGIEKKLKLGNINAIRDWGHAKDYVEMMWLMLQQKKPKDYVVSTGKSYSVRDFINLASKYLKMKLEWKGRGIGEKAYWINPTFNKKYFKSNPIITISRKYFRPSEVDLLKGNSGLAMSELKWKPKISFEKLVKEMINNDINILKKNLK